MPTADRVLVYQRTRGAWEAALAAYKANGLVLNRNLFTRRERCYKGPERCRAIWTESTVIASDYLQIGVENELGR